MADSDSNIIKPVDSLQNIPAAGRRENRKRRQQPQKENKEYSEQEQNSSADEQDLQSELDESEDDRNTIDYCA
ncbi:MAG TPA: hypothetical protein VMY06_02720 [Sedimentisphaerales bacterium]|nr:hypothetical protein [Sedimentisphaerales bacterium]